MITYLIGFCHSPIGLTFSTGISYLIINTTNHLTQGANMTAMKDFSTLPFTPTPTMVGIFKHAAVAGWEDITGYYGEADYNLTQRFRKGHTVLSIVWIGNGRYEDVASVKVGEEDVQFYDELSTSEELLARAGELFFKTDFPSFLANSF
jgi:hypothetical protein